MKLRSGSWSAAAWISSFWYRLPSPGCTSSTICTSGWLLFQSSTTAVCAGRDGAPGQGVWRSVIRSPAARLGVFVSAVVPHAARTGTLTADRTSARRFILFPLSRADNLPLIAIAARSHLLVGGDE